MLKLEYIVYEPVVNKFPKSSGIHKLKVKLEQSTTIMKREE